MSDNTPALPRVLIVDDSRIVRASIVKHIKGAYDFREESDGEMGWQTLLLDPTIQVVISDIGMPKLDGFGLLEELLFTPELDYLPQVSPKISAKFRSANLIAQLNATIAGFGIAVLPHFMAKAHPELQPVLPDEIRIARTFWMLMHADSKDLARIRAVADYIHETVEGERALFGGR